MRKTSVTLTSIALCLTLAIAPGASAFADTSASPTTPSSPNALYLPDNYQDPGISPLTRGQCTDSYSREWCNAHGYANNRPVGGKVKLTKKEEKCYLQLLAEGSEEVLLAAVTGSTGAFYTTPFVAWRFWNCMF